MEDPAQPRIQQLEEYDEKIQKLFKSLDKSVDKDKDMASLRTCITDYENALAAFKLEIRANRQKYQAQSKQFSDALKGYKNDMLFQEASLAKPEVDEKEYDSEEKLIEHGLSVQQDTKDSLGRTLAVTAEAVEIGKATAAKLAEQSGQIDRIHDNIAEIDTALARSKKSIGRLSKKVLTDKYLWVITFFVVAAIVGIVVWKAVAPSSSNAGVQIPGSMQMRSGQT